MQRLMQHAIKIHVDDHVAIAISDIPQGALVTVAGSVIEARQFIPRLHKMAICNLMIDGTVCKYGQAIGRATQPIVAGDHVHSHNLAISDFEKDYGFCREARPTDLISAESRRYFQGYDRGVLGVGTRNYVGVLTSVNCSATVASAIASEANTFLNTSQITDVNGVVALSHSSGCGMQGDDEGFTTLQRTLEGYARHPNFAGVLLVGLGCETLQLERLMEETGLSHDARFHTMVIQRQGGTRATITAGVSIVKAMLEQASMAKRSPQPLSALSLAVQCGGSDALSGLTANPALGVAGDWLIRHGGTVIYSETPEIYGSEHLLTRRAASPDIAEALLERIRWWEDYTAANGIVLDANPSPGNKAGGLTTILEKSLGAQAKSGSTNLNGVYRYGQRVDRAGLVFMDSPGYDPVSVTGQVASGANLIGFTTGRGSAFGFKPVPSIKLASNNALFDSMREDMDINCGDIVSGACSVSDKGAEIFERLIDFASGELTASERLGYGDCEFNPWKIGATL